MLRLFALTSSHRPRGRMALSVAGIALGVALGYGVHLVNRAAVSDVAAAVRALAGEADLEVRGARAGFSESLYPRIARVAGVAVASPALELDVGVAGAERTIRVIGLDILRAALLQPQLALGDRLELLSPDKVLLSAAAANALRLAKGDKLSRFVGQRRVALDVACVLPASSLHGVAALTDVATAQWRLGRLGELNRIDIRLSSSVNRNEIAKTIQALLPPGVHVSAVESLEEASEYPSRSYRVNLNVLALVALFTGGFLVFSAQALEVARRRGEHALLRVLGLKSSEIAGLALLEAAILGSAGALAGVGLGFGLASTAAHTIGVDLGAGAFSAVRPEIAFSLLPAVLYFIAGVAVAVAGAVLPALDAARRPPARALKAGDEQSMFERVAPAWPGLALLGAGAALAQLGPVGGLPLFGYGAIACVLVGTIALMPWFSSLSFRVISFKRHPWLIIALAQLRGAPGQSAVSLAAIVASFSLMAAMAVMVASFRQSVDDWLDTVLPAELYVRIPPGDTAYFEPGFEARLRALPQVARADLVRNGRVALDPARPPL